jgi:hypothetical protein
MKKPEWHDVLKPREAVIAGLVGLAVVWLLAHYVYRTGYYTAWGLTCPQWKDIGTMFCLLGFAVPYWLVKWRLKR